MRGVTFWPGPRNDLFQTAQQIMDASGARLRGELPGDSKPSAIAESLRKTRGALRAAPEAPIDPQLIRDLDLTIRLWPIRAFPEEDVDFALVSGEPGAEAGRIAHAAFTYAAMNARGAVTIAAAGDEAFRAAALDAAKDYPALLMEEAGADIRFEEVQVVACPPGTAEEWTRRAAATVGGADRIPAVRRSETLAVFEPLGDGAPPLAFLLSILLLLEHLNEHQAAARLDRALRASDLDAPADSLIPAVLSALTPR